MGDRYHLSMECPVCGEKETEVYFAPTCGFIEWECPLCKHLVDLCEYTGVSYEDASNAFEIAELLELDPVELAEKAKKLDLIAKLVVVISTGAFISGIVIVGILMYA